MQHPKKPMKASELMRVFSEIRLPSIPDQSVIVFYKIYTIVICVKAIFTISILTWIIIKQ